MSPKTGKNLVSILTRFVSKSMVLRRMRPLVKIFYMLFLDIKYVRKYSTCEFLKRL